MRNESVKWGIIMRKQWIYYKRKRIILSITYSETRIKLKRKIKLCKSVLKQRKDKLLNWKIIITIFKTILVLPLINWVRNSLGKERKWMRDVINSLQKFQSEIATSYLLKTKKKLLVINYSTKTRPWKSKDKKLYRKSNLWSKSLRILR